MGERVEQRRLQLFVPPRGLRLARAIERDLQLPVQPLDFEAAVLLAARRSAREASSPATMAATTNVTNATQSCGCSISKPNGGRK
jgi:hypothetical protein